MHQSAAVSVHCSGCMGDAPTPASLRRRWWSEPCSARFAMLPAILLVLATCLIIYRLLGRVEVEGPDFRLTLRSGVAFLWWAEAHAIRPTQHGALSFFRAVNNTWLCRLSLPGQVRAASVH